MNTAHLEAVAFRKVGSPEHFQWFEYRHIPGTDAIRLTGCVTTQVYAKGPRKGRPKYEGARLVAIVTAEEKLTEAMRYEASTGNCGQCLGDGKTLASASVSRPTTYRECSRCKGTGKAVRS